MGEDGILKLNIVPDYSNFSGRERFYYIFSCENSSIPRVLTHSLTDSQEWFRAIGHNSVIFQARTSKFCMVVHIDPPAKIGKKIKRGVAPRGRGTCEYTLKWA